MLAKPLPATLFVIAIEIGIGTDCRSTSKRTGLVASHAPVASPTLSSTPIAIAISISIFLLAAGQAGLDCGGLTPLSAPRLDAAYPSGYAIRTISGEGAPYPDGIPPFISWVVLF